jgi:hypothetical protein
VGWVVAAERRMRTLHSNQNADGPRYAPVRIAFPTVPILLDRMPKLSVVVA